MVPAKKPVPCENPAFFPAVAHHSDPMSTDSAPPPRSGFAVTLQIVSVVCFTFICYLTIGLPLAVLPGFVHGDLGF